MQKRVFIVHQWAGSPTSDWYQWLKSELESRGCEVHVPKMPHPHKPTIDEWVTELDRAVGKLTKQTYFIGHSIGCQTILRYLEKQKIACAGAVFVAGWFMLHGLEDEESERIAAPWIETSIDFNKVKQNLPKSIAIFSDNDPFVPLSDKDIFKAKLDAHIIVEHNKGHFTGEEGYETLPEAVHAFLKLQE